MLFKHIRRYYNVLQGGMDVATSCPKACDVLLGTPGAWLDLFFSRKGTAYSNSNISKDSWTTTTTVFVSRKCMARTSFFRLSRCWLRDFDSLVPFFLTMRMRGGSAICIHRDLLPEEAIVSHVITCQGRDHLMNIQSGRHNLVIVNVPFRTCTYLEAITWQITSLFHPHWPTYSCGCVRHFG